MPAPLSTERWRVVIPYLDRALELSGDERAAWLGALRQEDAALADDITVLLEKNEALEREGFLAAMAEEPPASLAGQTLGAYTLVSPLGRGGMGTVWRAERSDGRYQGQVAVKLLNTSLVGHDGEARFRREGSILARLRHPHIAQMMDAGVSPQGQPYLVLELVEGERIDRHCDLQRLGVEARVRLFLDVTAAVAHAHANLVVHRDLKPSNVLVASHGGVKLLDFGIAKLLESGTQGEDTALTREGAAVLTPEYAAPEQLTGGAVTTATDVYALGVVLYTLLSGRHPAGEERSSPARLVRAIVEVDPPLPSECILRDGGPPPAEIAAARGTTPGRLRSALRGDLDHIVAKALRKDPARRYASADALADDLRRSLSHQPVSVGADSLGSRAARFVRRHRAGVAAAAAVALAVVGGAAGIAWQAREARAQRDEAQAQLARATAVNDFMDVVLNAAAPPGKKFEVGDLLQQAAQLADRQFAGDDSLRAELLSSVGRNLLSAEQMAQAAPVLEKAAAIARLSRDPGLRARALCPLALLHAAQGELAKGEAMLAEVLASLPDEPRYALARASCLADQSQSGYFSGDADATIRSATAALALLDRTPVPARLVRLLAMDSLGYGHHLARHTREAEEAYARLWEALEKSGLERTSMAATALNNWSLVHFWGDISRAEALCRRAVALRRSIESEREVLPTATFNLAGALHRLARYDEAERLFAETIATAGVRQERRIQFDAMMELAEVYLDKGEPGRAAAQLALLDPVKESEDFNAWRRQQLAYYQARLALARGLHADAEARLREVADRFEQRKSKIPMAADTLIHLARAQLALGRGTEALASSQRAMALAESFVEQGSPSYLVGLARLAEADVRRAGGDTTGAQAAYRSALDHLQRTLGAGHPATAAARRGLSPG